MTTPFAPALLCLAITTALLSACGGGGGGGGEKSGGGGASSGNQSATSPVVIGAPAAPAASIGFAIKQLQFNWPAVEGATFYRVLESVDGVTFTPVGGDLSGTGYRHDIAVHTHNWDDARYQVQACNSAGCTTSDNLSARTGVLQAIGYFKASNTSAGDSFGWALALSDDGNTLAVGAPFENSSATDSGAVYVFTKTTSGWQQQAHIKASNADANANFGSSVALSSAGTTLAVGAPFEDGAAADAGAVYVFTRSGSSWTQQAYVKASNNFANNYFGWSVALSDDGNVLASGAPGEANSASGIEPTTMNRTAANAGAAYVFTRSGVNWTQQRYLKASNTDADDNFGTALALNATGNVLAVGAPYEASQAKGINGGQLNNSITGAGAVYLFARGSDWSQQAYIKASNTGGQDNFGATLALNDSGDTLAVGAPYESSSSIGIDSASNNTAASAGAAYVFVRGSGWTQQAYIKASNSQAHDDFGAALALNSDGSLLVVGAIGESSAATGVNGAQADNSKDGVGAAYLFARSGGAWTQQTYLKPSTATLGSEFGSAIGISANGDTLAIGGAFESKSAIGIGAAQTSPSATDAGALWLF